MGGARNVGTKAKTLARFNAVEKLIKEEPGVTLKDALLRYKLPESTYHMLREKFEPRRPLRLWSCFWGRKHIGLFEKALVRSLSWPHNKDAIKHATWDIWTRKDDFSAVVEAAKGVGIKVQLNEADSFIDQLTSKYLNDRGVMMLQMFLVSIKQCIDSGSQMLIAPPDTIFGGDSLANIIQAGEQAESVVFVVHIRVLPKILNYLDANGSEPELSTSNAKLVSLSLKNAHKSWSEAEYGKDRINTQIGGIMWKKRPNGVYAVQHMLPTPYLINWTNQDYEFFTRQNPPGQWPPVFGEIDHMWPGTCVVPNQRQRILGSSDDAFIVEITEEQDNIPAFMTYDKENPDRFWREAPHNKLNRQVVVTFREAK